MTGASILSRCNWDMVLGHPVYIQYVCIYNVVSNTICFVNWGVLSDQWGLPNATRQSPQHPFGMPNTNKPGDSAGVLFPVLLSGCVREWSMLLTYFICSLNKTFLSQGLKSKARLMFWSWLSGWGVPQPSVWVRSMCVFVDVCTSVQWHERMDGVRVDVVPFSLLYPHFLALFVLNLAGCFDHLC